MDQITVRRRTASEPDTEVSVNTMLNWMRGRRRFLGSLATAAGAAALFVGSAEKLSASDLCDKSFTCDQNFNCHLPFQCNNFTGICTAPGYYETPKEEEEAC